MITMGLDPLADSTALAAFAQGDEAQALATASEYVRNYCGWHIAPEITETVTLDGPGTSTLLLPTLHLTELIEITDTGQPIPIDANNALWSISGFVLRVRSPVPPYQSHDADCLTAYPCWSKTLRGIVATITHGYEQTPYTVSAVVCSIAERLKTGSGMSNVDSMQVGQVQQQYSKPYTGAGGGTPLILGLTAGERSALASYVIPSES